MGYLGVRSRAETAKLATVLLARNELAFPPRKYANTNDRASPAPILVREERVYHFVPTQSASPRAAGAEAPSPEAANTAAQAIHAWRDRRAAERYRATVWLAWVSVFIAVALVGGAVQNRAISLARRAYIYATYDEAIAYLEQLRAIHGPDPRVIANLTVAPGYEPGFEIAHQLQVSGPNGGPVLEEDTGVVAAMQERLRLAFGAGGAITHEDSEDRQDDASTVMVYDRPTACRAKAAWPAKP